MIYSGSRMIYSGSQSSFEFSEILIKAKNPDPCGSNPYYLSIVFLEIMKKFTFNQKEESTGTNYLQFFLFHTTVLLYTQSRIHRPKMRNKISLFIFCRIRNNNSGSGSRQKFLIHAEPDLQHWINWNVSSSPF